jgi:UDP-N-acetyl-D-mannosaminuronic acid dehydrogenase
VTVCVHGVGHVGLAAAALFANNGHEVVGYDPDEELVEALRDGDPPTTEPEFRTYVRDAIEAGFTPSHDPEAADYHVVCVPTPYDERAGAADLTYVRQASRTVADLLRPGDAVVLESTVPPGTTEEVLGSAVSAADLQPGADVSLAYCPETVLPGNVAHELVHNDRIVGGVDTASTERVVDLFEPCIEGAIRRAPDPTTAEFVKLAQNAYRDVNIAFANELARVAHDYGVHSRTAIAFANAHPRVDVLDPGPGVGGHCLPVDPHFLGEGSDAVDLVKTARQVNDGMAGFVVDLLGAELEDLRGASVAVLGVAYKGDVSDTRHSPGLRVAERLAAAGRQTGRGTQPATTDGGVDAVPEDTAVDIRLHDPHARHDRLLPLEAALSGADAVVVTTGHSQYRDLDPEELGALTDRRLVIDGPAALDGATWRDAGFDYVEV